MAIRSPAASGTVVKTDDLGCGPAAIPFAVRRYPDHLRTDRLVRATAGRVRVVANWRVRTEISIADGLRCIDGPLASVRDITWRRPGPRADRCLAQCAGVPVLEETTLADVAGGAARS